MEQDAIALVALAFDSTVYVISGTKEAAQITLYNMITLVSGMPHVS